MVLREQLAKIKRNQMYQVVDKNNHVLSTNFKMTYQGANPNKVNNKLYMNNEVMNISTGSDYTENGIF